jgi:hypothetical protein
MKLESLQQHPGLFALQRKTDVLLPWLKMTKSLERRVLLVLIVGVSVSLTSIASRKTLQTFDELLHITFCICQVRRDSEDSAAYSDEDPFSCKA